MRLEITQDGSIVLVVSRRNLLTLLDKLDNGIEGGPSRCTIGGSHIVIEGELCTGKEYWIRAESDDEHYGRPERVVSPPGRMHPDTESRL